MKRFLFLSVITLVFFLSCDPNGDLTTPSIVGTWKWAETAGDGDVYRFNADGTYTIHDDTGSGESLIEEGTYSFENGILTRTVSQFDDSGTYRPVAVGDYCRYEFGNCYLDDEYFSYRAMEGSSSSFIGTWSSFGAIRFYKLGAAGSYLERNYASSTRVFTSNTYTRIYDEYTQYDETGTVVSNSNPDFVYTDVSYTDDENWSGVDSDSDRWYIRSKLLTGGESNYHLFEFMVRM